MELKNYFATDEKGNLMPMATCYLYEAGTETLAGGIEDINGNPLANPFGVGASALIQLAAPDGIYDLRVVKGSRDYRLRVQFGDIPAAIQQVEAIAADAAGSAAAASESAASAADAAESKVAVLRSDLANATDPAKGSELVGYLPSGGTGSTVGDYLNLFDIQLDGYASLGSAIAQAESSGRVVSLPPRAITIPAGITIPGGTKFRGIPGKTSFNVVGGSGDAFIFGGAGVEFFGVAVVGGSAHAFNFNGFGGHKIRRCDLSSQGDHAILCDSSGNEIRWNSIDDCGASAIALIGTGAYDNDVVRNRIENAANFGIWVTDGAHDNNIIKNRTHNNGLELVGVTRDCHHNVITHNHAKGTGDNGISVTGYRNTVTNNVCELNDNHGIGVYGERNTVTANVCRNNGQRNLVTPGGVFAGITATPAFGGMARKNVIRNNICDDDQANPTQHYGVKLEVNAHVQWASGQTITSANRYRYNGLNVYVTTDVGLTTGATAPTHTSGIVSDGSVNWTFVASNINSAAATYQPWATGQAVVAGDYLRSGNNVYVAGTSGTTGATAPTHTSGSVSDGGVTWEFIEQFPSNLDAYANFVGDNSASGNLKGAFRSFSGNKNNITIPSQVRMSPAGRNIFSDIYCVAASPEGSVTADPGSLALRRDASTTPGIALFSKQTGSGNTGWLAVALRDHGATASRPDLASLGNGVRGYCYFDIDLGKPIWWKGAQWVDATGAAV